MLHVASQATKVISSSSVTGTTQNRHAGYRHRLKVLQTLHQWSSKGRKYLTSFEQYTYCPCLFNLVAAFQVDYPLTVWCYNGRTGLGIEFNQKILLPVAVEINILLNQAGKPA
jgi:hypothetical protein